MNDWISTSEAAAALRVSERTIQRRAAKGQITARKVTDADGEKWEVNLSAARGADTHDKVTPIVAPQVTTGDDTPNERESASVTPQVPANGASVPTGAAIGADTSETAFLRAQLEAMNEALKREQSAHEQTRQLLAGALQMASRQLPNATPPEPREAPPDAKADKGATDADRSHETPANRRGDGLAMLRAGLLRMIGR